MISYQDAKSQILKRAHVLSPQYVSLENALGYILAKDIIAPIDLPSFDNSQMDGVAIKANRLIGSQVNRLKITQIIKAGDSPQPLEKGTCAKIMTGAMLPKGADTVVPIEDIIIKNNSVIFLKPFRRGQFVRRRGEDIRRGTRIAKKGEVITSRTMAILAAAGIGSVRVYPKPSVTIITTGSELIKPGQKSKRGKIYDSNKYLLSAALKEMDIGVQVTTIADNERQAMFSIKMALKDSDILITSGGISVGEYDHVRTAIKKAGAKILFWRVAIKPGKPFLFAMLGKKMIFGLPGNPVSSSVTFQLFVRPAILKMLGHKDFESKKITARALHNIIADHGRLNFLRGSYDRSNGKVRTLKKQGSHNLSSLVSANCLVEVANGKIQKGDKVNIIEIP